MSSAYPRLLILLCEGQDEGFNFERKIYATSRQRAKGPLRLRTAVWRGACWWDSASGTAVWQLAHSAATRPRYQLVPAQVGQWFTLPA